MQFLVGMAVTIAYFRCAEICRGQLLSSPIVIMQMNFANAILTILTMAALHCLVQRILAAALPDDRAASYTNSARTQLCNCADHNGFATQAQDQVAAGMLW